MPVGRRLALEDAGSVVAPEEGHGMAYIPITDTKKSVSLESNTAVIP